MYCLEINGRQVGTQIFTTIKEAISARAKMLFETDRRADLACKTGTLSTHNVQTQLVRFIRNNLKIVSVSEMKQIVSKSAMASKPEVKSYPRLSSIHRKYAEV